MPLSRYFNPGRMLRCRVVFLSAQLKTRKPITFMHATSKDGLHDAGFNEDVISVE